MSHFLEGAHKPMGGPNAQIADREGQCSSSDIEIRIDHIIEIRKSAIKDVAGEIKSRTEIESSAQQRVVGYRVMDDRKRWRGSTAAVGEQGARSPATGRPKVVLNAGGRSFCLTHDKFLDHVNNIPLQFHLTCI
jgi:hypothetical protein